jgi:hypothetical protein
VFLCTLLNTVSTELISITKHSAKSPGFSADGNFEGQGASRFLPNRGSLLEQSAWRGPT